MGLNLEKAIGLYSCIDRRVPKKREAILKNLRPIDTPEKDASLPAKLSLLFHSLYLYIDYHFNLKDDAQPAYNRKLTNTLNTLLNVLEHGESNAVEATVSALVVEYTLGIHEATKQLPFQEIQVDLSSFEDHLLIGSLAFQNICHLACKHCGNKGQWDNRSHTLSDLEKALPKIRFPKLSHVGLSYHEPLTLPFLLDLVELLLENKAQPGIVTSGQGIPRPQVYTTLDKLSQLHQKDPGKLYVALSFDLFRKPSNLAHTAYLLNNYPVIEELKVTSEEHNHEATIAQLRVLENLVSSLDKKKLVQKAIATHQPNLSPTGAGMRFFLDRPEIIENYLNTSPHPLWRNEQLAPNVHPFFLFPGGDIAPGCNSEAAHFRSFGNIFRDSAPEIYANIKAFEMALAETQINNDYPRLILAERRRRSEMRLPEHLVTHYDILARHLLAQNRNKPSTNAAKHYYQIRSWEINGLASWEGIGITQQELIDSSHQLMP